MSAARTFDAMIATDLDGTLVGDPEALARLNVDLARIRGRVALVYVTGRVLDSTLGLIASEGLLTPDAIIAGVGTTIHLAPDWRRDVAWERRVGREWNADRVEAVAGFFGSLRRQPQEAQGPFKRSYWLSADVAGATMAELGRALRHQRVRARLIYSSERDLDVIPFRGGKGPATIYLAARLGVKPERVIACGDSGNDADLIAAGGDSAIVGNALPELVRVAPAHAYLAGATHAGGVHEALRHFGVV